MVLEIEQYCNDEVDSEREEEDDAAFTDECRETVAVDRRERSDARRKIGGSQASRGRLDVAGRPSLVALGSGSKWWRVPLPRLAFGQDHDLYAAAVKVNTALRQSPGAVATTRYSFDCPTIGSTFKLGPVMRHDVVGSFVEYPVSCPTGASASGGVPVDHSARLTVWPFQSPE